MIEQNRQLNYHNYFGKLPKTSGEYLPVNKNSGLSSYISQTMIYLNIFNQIQARGEWERM